MKSKEYTLNVRIPANLFVDLSRMAESEHTSKSEIARDMLINAMSATSTDGEHIFHSLAEWRKAIKRRANGVCEKCGENGIEAHHIRPVYQGGVNVLSNGVYLCKPCHNAMHRDKHKDPAHELVKVGYKLPQWLVDWIRAQEESAVYLIKDALMHAHRIKPPE